MLSTEQINIILFIKTCIFLIYHNFNKIPFKNKDLRLLIITCYTSNSHFSFKIQSFCILTSFMILIISHKFSKKYL